MLSTKTVSRFLTILTAGCLALCLSTNVEAGKKSIRPQKYDPSVEKVDDLFDAMESGLVDVVDRFDDDAHADFRECRRGAPQV